MHKQESVIEKEKHKFLSDFEIKTGHSIPTRKPELELI